MEQPNMYTVLVRDLRERAEFIEKNFPYFANDALLMYRAANIIEKNENLFSRLSWEGNASEKGVNFGSAIRSYR